MSYVPRKYMKYPARYLKSQSATIASVAFG